ncbi:LysE family translocator [Ferrovibrio sp.]|uniref:LysE family translocator n=1 Tax=Ferrovibrio sp. TaxID=1917215 RepID=UPI00311DCCA9
MSHGISLDFLVIALVVVVTPGTGVLFTIATGLGRGARASILAATGCTLGIVPHMLAAITGLAALMHTSALAFGLLKYAGVAYLLWMAWQSWRARGALSLSAADAPPPPRPTGLHSGFRVMLAAILVNILNPKLSVFFLAFLPQFVDAADPAALPRMLSLSGVFMAMTFGVFVLYGLFAAAMRDHVLSRPRVMTWLRRSVAAAFVGLGVKLALAER